MIKASIYVHIGGTDAVEESRWVFQHSGRKVPLFKWIAGEPNNSGGEENCIVLRKFQAGVSMNDISCTGINEPPMFIC